MNGLLWRRIGGFAGVACVLYVLGNSQPGPRDVHLAVSLCYAFAGLACVDPHSQTRRAWDVGWLVLFIGGGVIADLQADGWLSTCRGTPLRVAITWRRIQSLLEPPLDRTARLSP